MYMYMAWLEEVYVVYITCMLHACCMRYVHACHMTYPNGGCALVSLDEVFVVDLSPREHVTPVTKVI